MITTASRTDVLQEGTDWVAFCTDPGCAWSAGGHHSSDAARCCADAHEEMH